MQQAQQTSRHGQQQCVKHPSAAAH